MTIGEDWRTQLERLKPGWDSYGALAVSPKAIDAVACSLHVLPTTKGGIQVELHRDGYDIELYFSADGVLVGCCFSIDEERYPR